MFQSQPEPADRASRGAEGGKAAHHGRVLPGREDPANLVDAHQIPELGQIPGQVQGPLPAVRLDATPLGKKLYDTLAFRDEYELTRLEGTARGAEESGLEMACRDLEVASRFDEEVFGADRSRMLERLWRQGAGSPCVAMSFGPGLIAEGALLG